MRCSGCAVRLEPPWLTRKSMQPLHTKPLRDRLRSSELPCCRRDVCTASQVSRIRQRLSRGEVSCLVLAEAKPPSGQVPDTTRTRETTSLSHSGHRLTPPVSMRGGRLTSVITYPVDANLITLCECWMRGIAGIIVAHRRSTTYRYRVYICYASRTVPAQTSVLICPTMYAVIVEYGKV